MVASDFTNHSFFTAREPACGDYRETILATPTVSESCGFVQKYLAAAERMSPRATEQEACDAYVRGAEISPKMAQHIRSRGDRPDWEALRALQTVVLWWSSDNARVYIAPVLVS